jgi:hypothetical protein
MSIFSDAIRRGTSGSRPAATAVITGTLYFNTDLGTTVRSNGTTWDDFTDVGGSGITQLTGDVTAGPGTGSQATTIANNAVTAAKINADAVTTAKILNANVTEAKLLIADNTTADVSTSAHGFAPKAPNDANKFLDGVGAYQLVGAQLIEEQILGSDVASVTFSSFSAAFRHLLFIIYARTTEAVTSDYLLMQFNGDTGANYDHQRLIAVQTSVSSANLFAQTSIRLGEITGASASSASQAGYLEILIPFYNQTTFFKMSQASNGFVRGTSTSGIVMSSGVGNWRNTAAITQVVFLPTANNILTGSIFAMYGIK